MALTSIFPVRPDPQGGVLQQYGAEIIKLDKHAVIPHDPKEARRMLDELRLRQGAPAISFNDRRLGQLHEIHNAMLPRLALARRLGVRPSNAKPPVVPAGGNVSEDELNVVRNFAQQLDIDIELFESTTAEQRRIMKLESRLTMVIAHSNGLVDAIREQATTIRDQGQRIERLESIIRGPQAL
jgi:hypothetical protein